MIHEHWYSIFLLHSVGIFYLNVLNKLNENQPLKMLVSTKYSLKWCVWLSFPHFLVLFGDGMRLATCTLILFGRNVLVIMWACL